MEMNIREDVQWLQIAKTSLGVNNFSLLIGAIALIWGKELPGPGYFMEGFRGDRIGKGPTLKQWTELPRE